MGAALDLGLDLGALAGCYVVIGLIAVLLIVLEGLDGVLNISILGVRPFGFLADAIRGTLIAGLKDAQAGVEAAAAGFEAGLLDALTLLIGIPLLGVLGVKKALQYLWNSALPSLVDSITDPITRTANEALTKTESLAASIPDVVAAIGTEIDAKVAAGVRDAETYTATNVLAGIRTAEQYADQAVSKLQAAENAAIDNAVDIANAAKAAGLAAAKEAQTAAEAYAAKTVASAAAAIQTALDQVKAIAVGAEGDLTDFESYVKGLGLPGLIAGETALATLVALVLADTGLENASCRGKVKQICQTDATVWEDLLGGLLAIGFGFTLPELVATARPLIGAGEALIREAA